MMATTPDSRMTGHGGESRNEHFTDAASRISAHLATMGYSDGTSGLGGIDYQDTGRARPFHNGMNEDRDIPRFGADEYE